MIEQAREAAENTLALSPEAQEEYRHLRAEASVLAVDERAQLEGAERTLASAQRAWSTYVLILACSIPAFPLILS